MPAPWAAFAAQPGDNLYTASVLAMRPKTGEIVWHYQFTPNDPYDYDANWEMILADINVDGERRKVLMQLNRNGFLYVIDRTNGKLISAKPFEKVNWASAHRPEDRPAGRDRDRRQGARRRADRDVAVDARRQELAARGVQPRNRPALCANTMHRGGLYKHLPVTGPRGRPALPVRREPARRRSTPGDAIGHIDAIDPLTGKPNGARRSTDHPVWSAMLTTGGGLLFTGKETGEFIALDVDTGKKLWQFQTGSGINAQPITYTHNGKQYVTVLSGIGGL